jgi:DNA integrity scanning protein DisA with diadenylate cyclase activity
MGLVYASASGLGLRLSAALFQAFFAVLVLILVVGFHEDLRRFFEQIGSWGSRKQRDPAEIKTLDLIVRAVARLAAARTGALIVLPGREPVDRHVDGGVELAGRVSVPLLMSLFDTSSPGHDGAVVLRGSTVERFGAHLPLSSEFAADGTEGGTRHAAAKGLAERCDAICVVVSEERGIISIARDGELRTLSRPEDLAAELKVAYGGDAEKRRWWLGVMGLDAALSVTGALALWMAFIPGSGIDEITRSVRVEVTNLPSDLEFESVDPSLVDVTLRGLRKDLALAERDDLAIQVDAYLARLGRRTFKLSASELRPVGDLEVVEIFPEKVRISLRAPAETPQ